MKSIKFYLSSLLMTALVPTLFGQKVITPTSKTLQLSINQSSGTNGTAVVFNPSKKLYYAAIAGNETYPLETFSENGENIYQSKTQADVRGMWWNSKTNNIEANGYNEFGIISIKTDSRGFAGTGSQTILEGSFQPSGNSCGVADKKGKVIYYYHQGYLYSYNSVSGEIESQLKLEMPTSLDNVNSTTVIYTGQKKMEIGVLNHEHKEVYLFNTKKGSHTGTIKLPIDAPTHGSFRFSYANGYVFLYDAEVREWTGYHVFD